MINSILISSPLLAAYTIPKSDLIEIALILTIILVAWVGLIWSRKCEKNRYDITEGLPLRAENQEQINDLMPHLHDCYFDVEDGLQYDEEAGTLQFRAYEEKPKTKCSCEKKCIPCRVVLLRILHVESLEITDPNKIATYSINEIKYDANKGELLLTAVPDCELKMKISKLELHLEKVENTKTCTSDNV
ncbi:MAG: hypothetical protein J6W73_02860 [Verrucomicrobia bacterium]|nr:hypothetical protein [Verrucomicrobiota bacterium]